MKQLINCNKVSIFYPSKENILNEPDFQIFVDFNLSVLKIFIFKKYTHISKKIKFFPPLTQKLKKWVINFFHK